MLLLDFFVMIYEYSKLYFINTLSKEKLGIQIKGIQKKGIRFKDNNYTF